MTDPLTPTLLDELEQRLQSLAITASSAARSMAEMKSLRQEGNHERRSDLYFWPEPHETDYGKAANAIRFLRDQSGEVEDAFRDGFIAGDFAGGGRSVPNAVELAWQDYRARAALGSERG